MCNVPLQHYGRSQDNTESIRALLFVVINKLKYDESYNFANEVSSLMVAVMCLYGGGGHSYPYSGGHSYPYSGGHSYRYEGGTCTCICTCSYPNGGNYTCSYPYSTVIHQESTPRPSDMPSV